MKLPYGDLTTSQSCSCTSCTYRSVTLRPSMRRMLEHGSEIDKLYLRDFLPMREKKLLDRLVRTRAVYDDIRNQLLSDSNASNSTDKADLSPKTRNPPRHMEKDLEDSEKSDAVYELVNLVDKGKTGQGILSQCCSCCSCDSNKTDHARRAYRHRYAHAGSESSVGSGQRRVRDERRLAKPIRYKAKHIQSEPCTCTLKFSGLLKHESKVLMKKFQTKRIETGMGEVIRSSATKIKYSSSKEKLKNIEQRLKQTIGQGVRKSMEKMRHGKQREEWKNDVNKMRHRSSKEKIKDIEQRLQQSVSQGVKKSIQLMKHVKPSENWMTPEEVETVENVFRIKKDSLAKFIDDMEKKRLIKEWACEFECNPEECVPEECYKIKKDMKIQNKRNKKNLSVGGISQRVKYHTSSATGTSIATIASALKKEKKIQANTRSINIQIGEKAKGNRDGVKTKTKGLNHMNAAKPKFVQSDISITSKSLRANKQQQIMRRQSQKDIRRRQLQSHRSHPSVAFSSPPTSPIKSLEGERQAVRIGSSFSFNIEFYKNKPTTVASTESHNKNVPSKSSKSGTEKIHQRYRNTSSVTQNASKNVKSGDHMSLKRCLCTLKLKPHTIKTKVQKNSRESTSKSLQTMKDKYFKLRLKDYECDPMVCIPGQCDPIDCEKFIKKRNTQYNSVQTNTKHAKYRSKSTPSVTSRSVLSGNSENVQTNAPKTIAPIRRHLEQEFSPRRQAVRISSSLSFNIEFYRGEPLHNIKSYTGNDSNVSLKLEKKANYGRQNRGSDPARIHLTQKPSQISSSVKSKSIMPKKHNLRRCFCTLKLVKSKAIKPTKTPRNSISKGISTSHKNYLYEETNPTLRNRSTEKRNNIIKYALMPYECETGICVPGECDPRICQEIIKARKVNRDTKRIGTDIRTKTSYSITNKPPLTKLETVQSFMPTDKTRGNEIYGADSSRLTRQSSSSSVKQAVQIGSNLSFNVEFYKDRLDPPHVNKNEKSALTPRKYTRHENGNPLKAGSTQYRITNKHQKSTLAHVDKRDKGLLIGSAIKRCFCTLKLPKKGKSIKRKSDFTETSLNTKIHPRKETASKGTRTKQKQSFNIIKELMEYECEPNFCVPGQCDPYQCLERIKARNKLKHKEFGMSTVKSNVKSTSSTTDRLSKSNNSKIQSHLNKDTKKKRERSKYTTSSSRAKTTNNISQKKSRQAVRVGSTFSFDVVFSKARLENLIVTQDVSQSRLPKTPKNKGDGPTKISSRQRKSQSVVEKKMNKASGLRPLLKRCFCTLKLQNKNEIKKQKNAMHIRQVTTVAPVQVFYKNETLFKRKFNLKPTSFSLLPSLPLTNYVENKLNNYRIENNTVGLSNSVVYSTSIINQNRNPMMFMNPRFRSSFLAWNLQVQNKRKKQFKLEPYECEPGVCVPGECDPYECQKLIMKRLMKKASTMTFTDKNAKSVSSETVKLGYDSQKQQFNNVAENKEKQKHPEHRMTGLKYESLPKSHKQAIRIGSSFSFNIEFSKDRSAKIARQKKKTVTSSSQKSMKPKLYKSQSNDGVRVDRLDRPSQYSATTQDKGTSPKVKRCFCTLQLQKRGRIENGVEYSVKGTQKGMDITDIKTAVNAQQNTKKIRPLKFDELDPNECEPGVCIPGECDPYICLERIKKRNTAQKDFGAEVKLQKTGNTSTSMTGTTKRSRGNNFRYKDKRRHADSEINKPFAKKEIIPATNRQVVRLGSNFSFNVEFYKDKYNGKNGFDEFRKSKAIKVKASDSNEQTLNIYKESSETGTQDFQARRHKDSQATIESKEMYTRTSSFLKRCFCTAKLFHQENEVNKSVEAKPNKKVIKKVKEEPIKDVNKKIKTKNNQTASKKFKEEQVKISGIHSQTGKIKEKHWKLEPYECEPGFCEPGYCDPYICAERIKYRNKVSKMSSTNVPDRKSVSTNYGLGKTTKSTSSNVPRNMTKSKIKKYDHKGNVIKSLRKTTSAERNVVRIGSNFSFNIEFYKDKSAMGGDNGFRERDVAKNRKINKGAIYDANENNTKATSQKMDSDLTFSRRSQADAIKKENKASGMGPLLKRCFCTLALKKQTNKQKVESISQGTISPLNIIKPIGEAAYIAQKPETAKRVHGKNVVYSTQKQKGKQASGMGKLLKQCFCKVTHQRETRRKSVDTTARGTKSPSYITEPIFKDAYNKTKPYKLKPYECEPGVCVPGECDPYECEKRIKKRLQNKASTTTRSNHVRSHGASSRSLNKQKDKNVQSIKNYDTHQNERQKRNLQTQPPAIYNQSSKNNRQAVHIGSSFSFNVEFTKERSDGTISGKQSASNFVNKKVHDSAQTKLSTRNNSRTGTQVRHGQFVHSPSQCDRQKMECKGSSVRPLLKRCFCTLKLEKVGKQQRQQKNIMIHKDVSVATKKSLQIDGPLYREIGTKTTKKHYLEPYECEPGTCVPGMCDPLECYDRIKLRHLNETGTGTKSLSMKSISSSTTGRKLNMRKIQTSADRSTAKRNITEFIPRKQIDSNYTAGDHKRQCVRLGSSFNFDIEFFKDSSPRSLNNDEVALSSNVGLQKVVKIPKRDHAVGARISPSVYDKHQQMETESKYDKGSGMGPLLKRCFCTLTLHKADQKQVGRPPTSSKIPLQVKNKSTSTKGKFKEPKENLDFLEPYECEPGVCIPGQCDPYECLERIKKRGIRRQSRGVTTTGQRCVDASTGLTKNCNTASQSSAVQRIYKPAIVEEPRFPMLTPKYWQGVKIGSNINVNIEFYKENILPEPTRQNNGRSHQLTPNMKFNHDKTKRLHSVQINAQEKPKKCPGRCTNTNHCDLKNCEIQTRQHTESRASATGKALKRCFCTAKLFQTGSGNPKTTTIFCANELITLSPFIPRQYYVNYSSNKPSSFLKKCNPADCLIMKTVATKINTKYLETPQSNNNSNDNSNSDEMKTILPYTPHKFNKSASKTLLSKKSARGCPPCCLCTEKLNSKNKSKHSNKTKRLTIKYDKTDLAKQSAIQRFMCGCIKIFSKPKGQHNYDSTEHHTEYIETKIDSPSIKKSKSERCSSNKCTPKAKPKKSKSLKIPKTFIEENEKTCNEKYQKCYSPLQSGDANLTQKAAVKTDIFKKAEEQCDMTKKAVGLTLKTIKKVKFALCSNQPPEQSNVTTTLQPSTNIEDTKHKKKICLPECAGVPKDTTVITITGKNLIYSQRKEAVKKPKKSKKKSQKEKHPEEMKKTTSLETKHVSEKMSPTCEKEFKKNRGKKLSSQCARELAVSKNEMQKAEKMDPELLERRKAYKRKDAARKKKRLKKEKEMLKLVMRYRNTNDMLLILESIIDIGKLGFNTVFDITKSVFRCVTDPKNTAHNIKLCVTSPRTALHNMKTAFDDSSVGGTIKRIKLRIFSMKRFRRAHSQLEKHPISGYMLHICDEDPKLRMKKRKFEVKKQRKRKRETMDFKCSLYMASLRSRPWIGVYYLCPWFYPHCISMLNIWKQFTDIMLFLLAVLVWSPCILLMEACRACLCCIVCTG